MQLKYTYDLFVEYQCSKWFCISGVFASESGLHNTSVCFIRFVPVGVFLGKALPTKETKVRCVRVAFSSNLVLQKNKI